MNQDGLITNYGAVVAVKVIQAIHVSILVLMMNCLNALQVMQCKNIAKNMDDQPLEVKNVYERCHRGPKENRRTKL